MSELPTSRQAAALAVLLQRANDGKVLLGSRFDTFVRLTDPPSAMIARRADGARLYILTTDAEATAAAQEAFEEPHRVERVDGEGLFRHLLRLPEPIDGVVVNPEGPNGPIYLPFRTLYGFFLGYGVVRDKLVVHDGRHAILALDQNAPGELPWKVEPWGGHYIGHSRRRRVEVYVAPDRDMVDVDPVAAAIEGRAQLHEARKGNQRAALLAVMALDAAKSAVQAQNGSVARGMLGSIASSVALRASPSLFTLGAIDRDLQAALALSRSSAASPGER